MLVISMLYATSKCYVIDDGNQGDIRETIWGGETPMRREFQLMFPEEQAEVSPLKRSYHFTIPEKKSMRLWGNQFGFPN